MNQITHQDFGFFQTELLQVDFITFNITKLFESDINQLTAFFQNLGFYFNCIIPKRHDANPVSWFKRKSIL